jgi:TP901 family phage tail tape measure protein
MARKIEVQIVGDASSLSRAFRQGEASANRFGKALKFTGATVGITGVAAAITKAASATVGFDRSMRNVNSIAGLNEKKFKQLSKAVLGLAGKTAQAPDTLAKGLYDLVSSGFNAHQSMLILASSAKAATAGLTTTEISTKAVASVLNAYHLPAQQAAKVSDTLFQTVNRGVISFEQLSTTLGDVLPFASSLGVSLQQVGAAVSTMTKEGIGPEETMTRIKNVMVAMLKPGKDLSAAIKATGAESGEALVKQKGYQGALEAVLKTTDGTKSSVAKLFPNIRALGGVLALTGKNARTAHGDLNAFKTVTGATDKALKEQQKSISYGWQHIKAQISAASIEVGSILVPAFSKGLGAISGFISDTAGKFKDLKSKGMGTLPALGQMIVDGFTSIDWKTVGDKIGSGLSGALDFSKSLTPAMEKGINAAVSHIDGRKALSGILRVLSQALSAVLSPSFWIKNFAAIFNVVTFVIPLGKIFKIPGFATLSRFISEPIFRAVKFAGKGAIDLLSTSGRAAVDGFLGEMSKLAPGAARAGGSMVRKFVSAVGSLPGHAREMAGRVVTAISGTIANGAGAVGSAVGKVVAAILRPLGSAAGKVLAPVAKIGGAIVDGLRQYVGAAYRIGIDLVTGLAHGIGAAAGKALDAIKGVANSVIDHAKGILHINSPSKVFHAIGYGIGEGLRDGIMASAGIVRSGLTAGLLYPIDGAIAELQKRRDALQATFDKLDKQRERQGLVAAVKAARKGGGSSSSSGSGGGYAYSSGSGKASGLSGGSIVDALSRFGRANGLSVTSTTGGKHVAGSYHYKGDAVDLAGTPAQMMAFAKKAMAEFGPKLVELFYDPLGKYVKNGRTVAGAIGGHSDHVHIAATNLAALKSGGRSGGGGGATKLTGKLSAQQIRGVAYAAGFRGKALDLAVAIALAESGGNTGATNHNTNGTVDRGLFQINSVHGGMSTYGTAANAKAAYSLYKKRGGFADWATFNSGAYRKFLGNTGSGHGANVGSASGKVKGGDGASIADAIKALKAFDLEATRSAKLSKIDVKIAGLEKLKAFKDAITDVRAQITDKLNTAVQAFGEKWDATIGKAIDDANSAALDGFDQQTEAMVLTGTAAQKLALMRAEDTQKQRDDEDAANKKAMDDAVAAHDQTAILAAQAAIDATKRARDEVTLEETQAAEELNIRAQRAADRKALEDKQAADRQTARDTDVAAFAMAEKQKLDWLVMSLAAQQDTYAQFAQAVNAILAPLGLGFEGSSDQEATINAGPGVSSPWTAWGGHPMHRAVGGPVRAGFPYVVGERGREVFTPDQNGRIAPTGMAMAGGGGNVFIENATIGSTQHAEILATRLERKLRYG